MCDTLATDHKSLRECRAKPFSVGSRCNQIRPPLGILAILGAMRTKLKSTFFVMPRGHDAVNRIPEAILLGRILAIHRIPTLFVKEIPVNAAKVEVEALPPMQPKASVRYPVKPGLGRWRAGGLALAVPHQCDAQPLARFLFDPKGHL